MLLALLVLAFLVLAGSAALRSSATFDEPLLLAVGARGLHTGDFSHVAEHPRLGQYLYGAAGSLAIAHYPAQPASWRGDSRYYYARELFWTSGNDPERILMTGRALALLLGATLVVATFLVARPALGDGAALVAAALVAFVPDVLAHAGIAYNDLPLALAFLVAVYALDAAVRRPTPARAALAALAFTLAVCMKYSGLVLVPILFALALLEAASGRWRDGAWRRALGIAAGVFAAVAWIAIALIYLGDWSLAEYIAGIGELARQVGEGRPAYLLGATRHGGWWYFFPVALALKTPLALHALMLLAAGVAVTSLARTSGRAWMTHPARAPAVAAALFFAALLRPGLNIGTRHALALAPLVAILVAHGIAPLWKEAGGRMRIAVAALFAGSVVSTLSAYPYFLSYLSEYARGRSPYQVLVDSNTDWGQGLVALAELLRARGADRVALGYFGTAAPQAFGLHVVALPSMVPLLSDAPATPLPRYIAVSATQLAGAYMPDDPFRPLRAATPLAIVGGSIYVYDREALGVPLQKWLTILAITSSPPAPPGSPR